MSGVQTARLAQLTTKVGSGATPRGGETAYQRSGIPLIRSMNVHFDGFRDQGIAYLDAAQAEALRNVEVHAGDVLLNITGASIGRVTIAPQKMHGARVNQHVCIVRPTSRLDPSFLRWYLASPPLQRWINSAESGATRQALTKEKILAIEVPLLPLSEQQVVVGDIEKQFSRLDEAIANLQRVKVNLRRHRAATLRVAAEGTILPDLNGQAWTRARIGEVAQIIGGLTKNPKRDLLATKLPYLRVANVYANELRLGDVEYIGVADSEVEKLLLRRGDLLVVEGNGSLDQIGRVALWDGSIPNCVHQNHLIKVRFGEQVLPSWGLIWLLSPDGRNEIEQVSASTSGLHTLSTGKVARLPIPVPPVAVQRLIVSEVDRRLSIVRELEAEVHAILKRSQTLRQAILAKAFSGAPA